MSAQNTSGRTGRAPARQPETAAMASLNAKIAAMESHLRAGGSWTTGEPSEQARREELEFVAAKERAQRAQPVAEWPQVPSPEHFRLFSRKIQEPWMRSSTQRLAAEMAIRCPLCPGNGWAFVEDPDTGYRFDKPCDCRRWVKIAEALTSAGLPASAMGHRIEDLVWGGLTGHLTLHPDALAHSSQVLFTEMTRVMQGGERVKGRRGLLLWGSTGTGKSHIVQGLLMRQIIDRGMRGRWFHWPTWFSRLKAAMDSRNGQHHETTGEVLGQLTDAPVLVLEEIGGEKISDYSRSKLDEVLTLIEDNPQSTLLVTTNFSSKQLEGQIGHRSVSRLVGLCEVMEVQGQDWRRRM